MSLCGNNNPCPDLITGQKCGITYTGARYVPLFADPIEWDINRAYEPLTIVVNQGNSYTSKQFVPTGIELTNTTYWAETGNFNGQLEQYKQIVEQVQSQVNINTGEIDALNIKTNNYYNLNSYGVLPTNTAELNTTNFNNFFTETEFKDNDTIILPQGIYNVNNLIIPTITKLVNGSTRIVPITLDFQGILRRNTTGTVLQIGGSNYTGIVNINNLNINSADDPISYSLTDIGLNLINIGNSKIQLGIIFNNGVNLRLSGINSLGTTLNTFIKYHLVNGLRQIEYYIEDNGYITNNTHVGGEVTYYSNYDTAQFATQAHVYMPTTNRIGMENYITVSFESGMNMSTRHYSLILRGTKGFFINCRAEDIDRIDITGTADYIIQCPYWSYNKFNSTDAQSTNLSLIVQDYTKLGNFSGNNNGTTRFGGGTTVNGLLAIANNHLQISQDTAVAGLYVGSGDPNGTLTATKGNLYIDASGTTNFLYVKTSNNGSSDWKAVSMQA